MGADGEWVIQIQPRLQFTREQVALALAVTYGPPRPQRGPGNILAALQRMVALALEGEDVTAPEATVAAWREQLAEWKEVFPDA